MPGGARLADWVRRLCLAALIAWAAAAGAACLAAAPSGGVQSGAVQSGGVQSGGVPAAVAGASIRVDRMRHGDADRVVVWLRRSTPLTARQEGNELVLDLPGSASLAPDGTAPRPPDRWVLGLSGGPGVARLRLAAGARPRVWPWSDRVVIDVDDASPALRVGQFRPPVLAAPARVGNARGMAAPAKVVAAKEAPDAGRLPVVQRPSGAPAAVQTALAPAAAVALPAPVAPVVATSVPAMPAAAAAAVPGGGAEFGTGPAGGLATGPLAASAVLLGTDPALGGPAVLLPAARLTGAAAFVRDGELRVVLDAARLLDLSQLKDDPAFGGATERLLPDGMELRLRPAPGVQPRLSRREDGWVLSLGASAAAVPPVTAKAAKGVLYLAAAAPGQVVVVDDPTTGGRLLVGTQRVAGQRVAGGHRAAEWVLLPSLQGVVVQPLSDRVLLQDKEAGFELKSADPPALALLWPEGAETMGEGGRAMTRRFDLPGLPVPVLRRRLAEALRDAAMAPRTARTAPRLRVAEAMLACGLDAEAAAVLQVAMTDDPAARADPAVVGLSAMAAWLSARAGGVQPPPPGFDAASLGGSDEAALWRALWGAPGGDAQEAAGALAARWRLLLDYPEHLRRPMLPAVAAMLAAGGQDKALGTLLAAFPDGSLDLARAGLLGRQGKMEESLRLLDHLGQGADRLVRAQALETAAEVRLAKHQVTPSAAADLLEHQFYAWRGGDRELRLRLRAADLRAQAGSWRQALALLRETDALFADAHGRIHDSEIAVVSDLLHADRARQLGALDLVALADDASGLLGAADADAALAPLLADRLLALDLPAQAEPIIRRLLDRAGDGAAKGALGLRLAQLMADRGDPAGALTVLDGTGDPAEAGPAAEARGLLRARLLAAGGHAQAALDVLTGMGGRAPLELQASLREGAHDWPGAAGALRRLLDLPDTAALADQPKRDLVLRAARDASEAGDMAGLRALRSAYAPLFTGSANAGLFGVLTADPVQRVDDLPRAGRELVAMRTLGKDLGGSSARRTP